MATITLRPNGAGDITQWFLTGAPTNWEAVDDVVADNGTTEVGADQDDNRDDLYTIESNSLTGSDVIENVSVYAVGASTTNPGKFGDIHFIIGIKEGGTITWSGTNNTPLAAYTTYSESYDSPPTGGSWEKSDIDSLQIGIRSFAEGPSSSISVTQMYVIVTYTPGAGSSTSNALFISSD